MAKNNVILVPHLPYTPDLAPSDYFMFPKMNCKLYGRRFDTVEEMQAESQEVLKGLTSRNASIYGIDAGNTVLVSIVTTLKETIKFVFV